MRVIHFEDDSMKHSKIARELQSCGIQEIEWVRTLNDGIHKLTLEDNTYDLIISDMWFPKESGTPDEESGHELITFAKKHELNIPIIICSSIQYRIPDILGAIHYSDKSNWEQELRELVNQINC